MPYLLIYFSILDQLVVGFGIVGILIDLVRKRSNPKQLHELLPRMFAYGTIPIGFAFLACAFDPTLLVQLESINIYIAAAGCAVLYVAWDAVKR
jgi:hypothetical protein